MMRVDAPQGLLIVDIILKSFYKEKVAAGATNTLGGRSSVHGIPPLAGDTSEAGPFSR